MSGIPLQKRTEYCFYVKLDRDPLKDSFLYFTPFPNSIKYSISGVNILSDEGRWWAIYKKPWVEGDDIPNRLIILFGSEIEVFVRSRKIFKRGWKEVCMTPLKISLRPIKIYECEMCNGEGSMLMDYTDVCPIEENCPDCRGLGKVETRPSANPHFDFMDDSVIDRVKAEKSLEEYDKFLMRLESEKQQRLEKAMRREKYRGELKIKKR